MPALDWSALFGSWRLDLAWTVLAVVVAAGYLGWAIHRRVSWARAGAFLLGVAVLVLALDGGVAVYGEVLFWMHMVQHLMLIMVAPALLAAGLPPPRGQSRGERRGGLTLIVVALAIYTVVLAGVHLTGFVQAMMTHPLLADLEHAAYLVSGLLLFGPVVAGGSAWPVYSVVHQGWAMPVLDDVRAGGRSCGSAVTG